MAIHPSDLPLIDDFNRADGALSAAPWSGSKMDTADGGTGAVATNRLSGNGVDASTYTSATYAKAAGARAALPVLATGVNYPLCLVQTGNVATPTYYRLRYDPAGSLDYQVARVNAGAATYLCGGDISSFPISAGDELALTIDTDNTVAAWIYHSGAWTLIDSVVDASPLAGPFAPGFSLFDSTIRLDDFRGGNPTTSVVETASTGGGVGGGVAPKVRVATATGGALGGGNVADDGSAPAAPREILFAQPLNLAARVTVRRFEAQGVRISYKLGAGHAAPSTPTGSGFTVAYTAGVTSPEIVSYDVPLPTNDDDYTLAVFGWNGASASTASEVVTAFGVDEPTPSLVGRDWAAMVIATDRPGTPYLRTATNVAMTAGVLVYNFTGASSAWRVYASADDLDDPTAGVQLNSGGWGEGSAGLYVRRSLAAATADRWHEWAHRVRAT